MRTVIGRVLAEGERRDGWDAMMENVSYLGVTAEHGRGGLVFGRHLMSVRLAIVVF